MINKLKSAWLATVAYLLGSRHSGDGNVFESRIRRLLILLPLVGTLLLLLWTYGVREPRAGYLLERHRDLIELETAINDHRLRLSDQQYADLQIRLRDAELFILPDTRTAARLLDQAANLAAAAGWTSIPSPDPITSEPLPGQPGLNRVVHPLVLEHPAGSDPHAFASMLHWLDQLEGMDQRIDVLAFTLETEPTGILRARLRLGLIQRSQP